MGRISLLEFLFKRKVLNYPTPFCSYRTGVGSTSHFLSSCPLYSPRPKEFKDRTKEDLLSNPFLAKIAIKWAMQTKALLQFKLAKTLLYNPP